MKLNLLPQSVSKAGAIQGMWIVASLLAIAGIAGAFILTMMGDRALADAKASAEAKRQLAVDAKATADHADKQIAEAAVINRNQKLAEAMIAHNGKYVQLYQDVLRYVPSYYRLRQISASPTSETQTTVTLTGFLDTFRQYADLSVALWKIPGAVSVNRSGFTVDDSTVSPLTESDQRGSVVKPGETPLPTDSMEQMDALIARASNAPKGFRGAGGFGTTERERGAMEGFSEVIMTIVLNKDVRTPDPRATISAAGGAGAGAAPAAAPGGVQLPGSGAGGRRAPQGLAGSDADGGK